MTEAINVGSLWRNLKKRTIYPVHRVLPDASGKDFVVYGEPPNIRHQYVCHTEIEGQHGLIEDGVIRWLKPDEPYPKGSYPWARPIELWHSKFEFLCD